MPALATRSILRAGLVVFVIVTGMTPSSPGHAGERVSSDAVVAPFESDALNEALRHLREHLRSRNGGLGPDDAALDRARTTLASALEAGVVAHELPAATRLVLRVLAARDDATAAAATAAVAAMTEPELSGALWLEHRVEALRAGISPHVALDAAASHSPDSTPEALDRRALVASVTAVRRGDVRRATRRLKRRLHDGAADARPALCTVAIDLVPSAVGTEPSLAAELLVSVAADCAERREGRAAGLVLGALRSVGISTEATRGPEQRLRAARHLYDAVAHDEVIAVLAPIVSGVEGDTNGARGGVRVEHRCEAIWRTAMTYRRSRRASKSERLYALMAKECAALPEWHTRALYGLGWNAFRSGDHGVADRYFEQIIGSYPASRYADDAVFYRVRIAARASDESAVRSAVSPILDGDVRGDLAGDAVWRAADALSDEDEEEALALLERAAETLADDPSYFSQGRPSYVLGWERDSPEYFESVLRRFPMSFYGWLAASAPAAKASDSVRRRWETMIELARMDPSPLTFAPLPDGAVTERAMLWLASGETARAAEILRAAHGSSLDSAVGWLAAYGLHLEGRYAESHDLARRVLSGWQRSSPNPTNRLLWEIAYPRAYPELVREAAEDADVPSALIHAIMREESGFRPKVESYAHAIGLMQLLESTGRSHARRALNLEVDAERLRDPAINIAVGAAFLGHLSRRLAPHPVLVAGAYNAGRGRMSRWLRARGSLALHAFVESMPFTQTRDYSKRVVRTMKVYEVLYGDGPVPSIETEEMLDSEMW